MEILAYKCCEAECKLFGVYNNIRLQLITTLILADFDCADIKIYKGTLGNTTSRFFIVCMVVWRY